MQLFTRISLLVAGVCLLISTSSALPRTKRTEDGSTAPLQAVDALNKLDELATSLTELRSEIASIKSGNTVVADSPIVKPGTDDTETPHDLDERSIMDLAIPQPQRRQSSSKIGWQPLRKRKLAWQPLKKRSHVGNLVDETQPLPRFTVRIRDNAQLRQQMMNVVERHLLDDLAMAEQYGIDPSELLNDLRAKKQD